VRDGVTGLRPFHLGPFHLIHRMGLLSFFERGNGAASAGADGDAVQSARTRARQRLIGAIVLVVAGVIGFPLVFETQPRPIPLDIPIEIPRRDGAPALVMPAARRPAAPAAASGVVAPRDDVITEAKVDAGKEMPPPAASGAAAPAPAKPASPAAETPKKIAEARPAPPAAAPVPSPAPAADAARAKALLEGSEPAKEAKEGGGRFVLQVGAFADAAAARDTRAKVEKLGLKTYTQVVETSSGSRTRVRVGPFGSRDEADKALAKTRDAGISAVVLTL
jgi:DedD protein